MWFQRTSEIFTRTLGQRELESRSHHSDLLHAQLGNEMYRGYCMSTTARAVANRIFEHLEEKVEYNMERQEFSCRVVVATREEIAKALALAYFAGAEDARAGTVCR